MFDQVKFAVKSLLKNKAYTLINLGGLPWDCR
jgi:hypothetical protein